MIQKPHEITHKKTKSVLIGGQPGLGKSTLGLSAPNPLLIDMDDGVDRIPAHLRTFVGRIGPVPYDELLADLSPANLTDVNSIVIDTGGALFTRMKPYLIQQNPKNGQNDGQTLSMKGFGAAGQEFMRLCTHITLNLQKNLVVLFHMKEENDGDSRVFRLDIEGQTRANIWKSMDLGGFLEMQGNKRTIGFSPTERYFAKSTHGIQGVEELPDVMKGAPNTFLTDIFNKIDNNIAEESKVNKIYTDLMVRVRNVVDAIKDAKSATEAMDEVKGLGHIYSSKTEAWHLIKTKATACGLEFSKEANAFVVSKINKKVEAAQEPSSNPDNKKVEEIFG